jgi:hypothetical protein
MSLRDAIVPAYIDINGLVAPSPVNPTANGDGSDNGPLYTSEYYIMLSKLGQLTDVDKIHFDLLISQCITPEGMLCRLPTNKPSRLEQADDYYGVLNGCKELGFTSIPRHMLDATITHLGFLNNVDPTSWTLSSFLIRQPQLLASIVSASFPSIINPLHYLIRLIFLPLYIITAIIIATSCINTDISNSDARILSWHLVQINKSTSLLCKLASSCSCHILPTSRQ